MLYPCQSRDTIVWLRNPGCDTLIVDSVTASPPAFSRRGTGGGFVLPPDTSLPIYIHCQPDTNGAPSALSGTVTIYAINSDSAKVIAIPLTVAVVYPEKMMLALSKDVLRTSSSGPALTQSPEGTAGDRLTYTLLLTGGKDVRSTSLRSISFSLTNDDDLLSLNDAEGVHLDSTRHGNDGRTTRYYTLAPIPANDTLATLTYTVYLAASEGTRLLLGDVRFENSLGLPNDCVASISTSDTIFTYLNGCADPLFRQALISGDVMITNIVPNPAGDFVRVEGHGLQTERLEVYDQLGRTVTPMTRALEDRENILIDVRSIPEGLYYLRIGQASARFEVLR
jgi:hypothetical protein